MRFVDRTDAGRKLAVALARYQDQHAVVLALPRGGVPVAREVAIGLNASLDLVLVRKIGVPEEPELAMGAVVDGPEPLTVENPDVVRLSRVTDVEFEAGARATRLPRYGGAAAGFSASARTCAWPGGPSSWSTTASPPAQRCGRHSGP